MRECSIRENKGLNNNLHSAGKCCSILSASQCSLEALKQDPAKITGGRSSGSHPWEYFAWNYLKNQGSDLNPWHKQKGRAGSERL